MAERFSGMDERPFWTKRRRVKQKALLNIKNVRKAGEYHSYTRLENAVPGNSDAHQCSDNTTAFDW